MKFENVRINAKNLKDCHNADASHGDDDNKMHSCF